ncbi:MAG TPA: TrmH family RNA methyltransferase [Candidatus Sumerlaeota bacterium]|nr:TrmH family RNA methyltransferase [Candidatus Sumerlaeota bacterium]
MRRWTVILISPKESGNVGAAARVLKNFGAGGLRVVAPRCEINNADSRRFSSGAAEILRGAQIFDTLDAALADRELVIGLTGVGGKYHKVDCVGLLPEKLLEGKDHLTKCALLFGREENGMVAEELERCDFRWSLPSDPDFPSLNLAQAIGVALCAVAEEERRRGLSQLGRGIAISSATLSPVAGSSDPGDRPATADELQHLAKHCEKLMTRIGWNKGRRMKGSLQKIRNVLARASATEREVNLLHGLCKQALIGINNPEHFSEFKDAVPDNDTEDDA